MILTKTDMGTKSKQRLLIMCTAWYLIATTWIGTYIFKNYLVEGYEVAYWLSITFHYIGLYIMCSHYLIEGKD